MLFHQFGFLKKLLMRRIHILLVIKLLLQDQMADQQQSINELNQQVKTLNI